MDVEGIIAKLHEERGLIDRAIADLERLPVRRYRGPGRPRNGKPAVLPRTETHGDSMTEKADAES